MVWIILIAFIFVNHQALTFKIFCLLTNICLKYLYKIAIVHKVTNNIAFTLCYNESISAGFLKEAVFSQMKRCCLQRNQGKGKTGGNDDEGNRKSM
jgi:hypothetical protein